MGNLLEKEFFVFRFSYRYGDVFKVVERNIERVDTCNLEKYINIQNRVE